MAVESAGLRERRGSGEAALLMGSFLNKWNINFH